MGIEEATAEAMRDRPGHLTIQMDRFVITRDLIKRMSALPNQPVLQRELQKIIAGDLKAILGKTLWCATATIPEKKYGPLRIIVGGHSYGIAMRRLMKALEGTAR